MEQIKKLNKPYFWCMYKLYCFNNGLSEGDFRNVEKWRKVC